MRTLFFYVNRQISQPYRYDEIKDLVAGTEGYIQMKFDFSSDWKGCKKAVGFFSLDGAELTPRALDDENCCLIPKDALDYHEFSFVVYGKRDGYSIKTKPFKITQYGGKK